MQCAQSDSLNNFTTLYDKKFNLLDTITFDDHHQYKYSEVAKLHGNIVTTEKDAVKLAEFDLDNIYALKLKLELDVESILK